MIKTTEIRQGVVECVMDLGNVYPDEDLKKFNSRWEEFLASDPNNALVLKRIGNTIAYPHKSWLPRKKDNRPSVFLLLGNPASHSVREDIYFSYEGKGQEHRFWKVLRELGFININTDPRTIKQDFFNLEYESPFRLGLEVIYTFPSSASKPKWSGVVGLERLFGRKVMKHLLETERTRVLPLMREFTKDGGAIIALQKDAYNAVAQNTYSLKQAMNFELKSKFNNSISIYGTPPTRWLYTMKMKELLRNIRAEILASV